MFMFKLNHVKFQIHFQCL